MGQCNTKKIKKETFTTVPSQSSKQVLQFECMLSKIEVRNMDHLLSIKKFKLQLQTNRSVLFEISLLENPADLLKKNNLFVFSIEENQLLNERFIVVFL